MNILTKSKRIGTQPADLWREATQQKCLQLLASGRERLAATEGDPEAWGRLKTEWASFLHQYLEDTRPDFGHLCEADMLHEATYDGFRLQNMRLTLSSGWQIGLNLFLPPASGPAPGPYVPVLCPCGHGPKWLDDHQIPPQVLARNGFAAALFDMPMFGERERENDHFVQGAQALMAGWWSNHFFLVDALQVADYLQTRAEIDFTHGMAVTGVSGGGFSTLFLALMDPCCTQHRITAIAPVCSVASLRGHIIGGLYTGCLENDVRGQFLHGLDLDHLLCLAAPLPCLVIGGRRDDMFRWENMQQSVEQAQRIYAGENAAGKLAFFVDESEHKYTRRMAGETAAWFRRWLLQAEPLPASADIPLLPREALDCGTADHSRTIFGFVRDAATALSTQRRAVTTNAAIAAVLGIRPQDAGATSMEVEAVQPETPWHYAGMHWQVIHPADGLPLPVLRPDFPSAPEGTLVCFGDTGKLPPVRMSTGLWELRRRVLSADVRGFGELAPAPSPYDLYSWCSIDRALYDLLFLCGEDALGQQTLDGLRVLNATLSAESTGEVIVYGHGEAALPALFAGLLHPQVSRIVLDHYPCSFESLATHPAPAWQRYLYVADILKAFDIPDLVRARTDKQFLLIHPLDARKQPLDEIAALRLYGPELPNATVDAAMGDVDLKAVVSAWLNQAPLSDQPVDPTLALHGGKPVCDTALPSKWHGVDLIGQAELDHLQEVVRTKTPFRHYGPTAHKPRMAEALEQRVADMFGVKYALAVTSGSAALSCALAGLGVGPGDEVILPAFAWISCYNAIVLAGALPVFCDIDESLTIDPADFERKITPATKAALVVHYQGGPARMDAIQSIARRHSVKVLEDSAQSAGARYQGHYLSSLGDVGILSFQTAKVVTSGEGGMVLTDDAGIFERAVRYHDLGFLRPTFDAQLLRQAGSAISDAELARRQFSVDATFVGNQYRMNELSAAVALAQLDRLDWAIERCHTAWDLIQHHVAARELPIHFRRSNDYAGDGGIALFVDLGTAARARSFREALAAEIPNLGPSSHVSNLLAEDYVLARRMAHPNLPPFGPGFNGEKVTYARELAPNADALPARMVAIGIGPRYTRRHAEIIAAAIVKVYGALFGENE